MTDIYEAFKTEFWIVLEKCSSFTTREIRALWAILATLINGGPFSMRDISERAGRRIGRNFLSLVLKKYAYVQKSLIKLLFQAIVPLLKVQHSIEVVIDDSLVQKTGAKIFGSFKWFDHGTHRVIQAICLVNLAILVDGQVVLIIPWILVKETPLGRRRKRAKKEQDKKTSAAIEMLKELFAWFKEWNIPLSQVTVLADAWYSSRRFVTFVRQSGAIFLVAGKKNYGVQEPDQEAIANRDQPKPGPKRQKWVIYTPLHKYLGKPETWQHFTDPRTGQQIHYKKSQITLKTTGRVNVYAYWRSGSKNPLFLLTNARRKRPFCYMTVFRKYTRRWLIEVAHRELKQQFGLGSCQARDAWVVHGFIGLVFFAYSLWKLWTYHQQKEASCESKCPTWAKEFHKLHHYYEVAETLG